MKQSIYIAAVAVILLFMAVGAPILRLGDALNIFEIKNLGNKLELEADQYEEGSLSYKLALVKDGVTRTYTNYLPFYYDTVFAYGETETLLNNPFNKFYASLRTKPAPVKEPVVTVENPTESTEETEPEPIEIPDDSQIIDYLDVTYLDSSDTKRYYLVDAEFADGFADTYMEGAVSIDKADREARVRSQAEILNRLIAANDSVDFYFVLLTRLQDMKEFPELFPEEDSTRESVELFLSLLPDTITKQVYEVGSLRDRMEKMYYTDHHWTAEGIDAGYRQLLGMMRPDLTPLEHGKMIKFPGCRFYGSYTRKLKHLEIWDTFRVYEYPLPKYNTVPKWNFDERVRFLSGKAYTTPDHYVYHDFFPEVYEVHYPDNHYGRNLLIIGDSYTQGIATLLASAFDNTYIYYYSMYSGMNYNEVIEENNITDVLFMQYTERILFDLYGDCKLANINLD